MESEIARIRFEDEPFTQEPTRRPFDIASNRGTSLFRSALGALQEGSPSRKYVPTWDELLTLPQKTRKYPIRSGSHIYETLLSEKEKITFEEYIDIVLREKYFDDYVEHLAENVLISDGKDYTQANVKLLADIFEKLGWVREKSGIKIGRPYNRQQYDGPDIKAKRDQEYLDSLKKGGRRRKKKKLSKKLIPKT